jgi:hypothetical protein
LLWVVENFYEWEGQARHELGLYFLMSFPPDFAHFDVGASFVREEEGGLWIFDWFPVDGLQDLRLYPTFLRRALSQIPSSVQHIVHVDTE